MTSKNVCPLNVFSLGRAASLAVRDLEAVEYYPTYLLIKEAAENDNEDLIDDLIFYPEYSELSLQDLLAFINKEADEIWDTAACLMGHIERGQLKMKELGEIPKNTPNAPIHAALEKSLSHKKYTL